MIIFIYNARLTDGGAKVLKELSNINGLNKPV